MLEKLKPYQEKIDALLLRERVLLFLSLAAVVFMIWNFLIQMPIDRQKKDKLLFIESINTQITALQKQIVVETQAAINDPNINKKAQVEQLEGDVNKVESRLHSASESLIRAEQLPEALQQVLQKTANLRLIEVRTLPAKELQMLKMGDEDAAEKEQSDEAVSAGVFKHTVVVTVNGSFFQVVDFLAALEQLPWRFYWQSLDYKVTEYPNAEITLRVYTLSSEEGLFGV